MNFKDGTIVDTLLCSGEHIQVQSCDLPPCSGLFCRVFVLGVFKILNFNSSALVVYTEYVLKNFDNLIVLTRI